MRYSIDTSAFIQGWNDLYPIESFGHLWENIGLLIDNGDARSTIEVKKEIIRCDDGITEWVDKYPQLFIDLDLPTQEAVRIILDRHEKLVKVIKNRSSADPFVIALAMARGATVVTEEKDGSPEKPRIPDVCQSFGVKCIRLVDLIKQEGWKF